MVKKQVDVIEIPPMWCTVTPRYIFEWLVEDIKSNKHLMKSFGEKCVLIMDKYPNKREQRKKLIKLQGYYQDLHCYEFMFRRQIMMNIIRKSVKDYHKEKNSYESIMKELDGMIWEKKPEEKILCDCRNKGFGLCFCTDKERNYINPPWGEDKPYIPDDSAVRAVRAKEIPNAWLSGSTFTSKWSQ